MNKITGVLLESSHYTKEETKFLPKGTLMFHYALTDGDLSDFETAKGSFLRKVEDDKSPYFEKPMHFTSQIPTVSAGEEVVFTCSEKGQLSVYETLEERTAKAIIAKRKLAMSKALSPETVAKMELAKELGLNVTI